MSEEWFGRRLRDYRAEHHMTQRELGRYMDMSVSHISALERGKKRPRASTIRSFQRLVEAQEWRKFDIIDELSEEEFEIYMNLWQRMRELGPQKEKEAIIIFIQLVNLF